MSLTDEDIKKKKKRSKKIHPTEGRGFNNEAFELGEKPNNQALNELRQRTAVAGVGQPLGPINNMKLGKYGNYRTTRRDGFDTHDNEMYENGAKGGQLDDFETPDDSDESLATKDMMVYFKDLATSIDENDTIDLYYLEKLLQRGADINAGDKYGQTVFHEVARCWHTDVAKFMIENGAKVNQGDNKDRRPLHVAAAVNYPEMVSFLLDSGAEIEAAADGNGFTAITCAAANDACDALTVLYQRGADIHQKDPKGRTPLMVAALGDRSETCKLLLSLGAKADLIDENGEPCIVTMLSKMPAVAGAALNQFHRTDGANRAQYYDLHYLEPQKPGEEKMRTRMPMEVVVHYRQFDNIDHEVFRELLDVKWQRFGKRAAIIDFCIDLIYILLWTALAVIKPDGRGCYYFPGDVWRVILWALAISYTVFLIIQELMEYFVSKSEFNEWKEWKRSIISDDMKYCHPKWPHEKIWLDRELEETNNVKASYFHDYWNIFDWCVYILLVFCVIFHLIDIGVVSDELCWPEDDVNATADGDLSAKINSGIRISEDEGDEDLESVASMIHIRLFAITIIFVWIRLLKPTRAFMTLGPFIVMCYKILGDVARFSFLYMVFYIPYTSAFWMMFGGDVEEFETVSETLFSLFRLTLVDEYNYDGLKEENPVMCDILVGTYLAISAIVLLNLFIAMLSETFVRVHDNAHSNALMERAAIVLGLEDNLSDKKKEEYYKFIHGECSPRKKYYDDDMVTVGEDDDVRKITFHIKDQMTTLIETINNQADGNASSRAPGDMTAREASQAHEIRQIHLELNQIKMHQMESLDKTQKNMEIILNVLNEIASQSRGSPVLGNPRAALTAIHDEYGDDDPDRSRQDRHHPKRGRHKDEFQSFGSDRDGK